MDSEATYFYLCIMLIFTNCSPINMAFYMYNATDEKNLSKLEEFEARGPPHPFNYVELDPRQSPEDLPAIAFAGDGRAYFFSNFGQVSGQGSRNGWRQHSTVEAIRDVSEELGYKETYKFAKDGRISSNWSMTKYFLHKSSSSRNKNAIYVICNT